jgi:twitching motility protein PilI
MADNARRKASLREFQQRLAERLSKSQSGTVASYLAVEVADLKLLLPLSEAGEISAPPVIQPLPRCSKWFMGVTTLRGRVVGVVDLAVFLGVKTTIQSGGTYLALGDVLEVNCLLRIDRLLGLRGADQFTVGEDQVMRDVQGNQWQTLSLSGLAADEQFLKIYA